jgi:hypothetical protein
MDDVNKDEVEEKLHRALAATSAPETAEVTPTEEADVSGENRVPQSRFNEVNQAAKLAREEAEHARATLAETQDKLVRMAELLEAKEADVRTLNEIKSFVNDPEMKDHVIAIDHKLKGIETIREEVDAGTTSPEDAVRLTQELLDEAREEMRDTQADVQADQLIAKADALAERLLNALPEEYNAEDLAVINDLFHEKVDWDAAVAYPDSLSEILTEGFQATIDRYGMPRGALFNAAEVEVLTPEPAEIPQTPEEELAELMELNWGGTRVVETTGGRTKVEPELSDDDFNAVLAQTIRLAHAKK